jgi:hypothetical protein
MGCSSWAGPNGSVPFISLEFFHNAPFPLLGRACLTGSHALPKFLDTGNQSILQLKPEQAVAIGIHCHAMPRAHFAVQQSKGNDTSYLRRQTSSLSLLQQRRAITKIVAKSSRQPLPLPAGRFAFISQFPRLWRGVGVRSISKNEL